MQKSRLCVYILRDNIYCKVWRIYRPTFDKLDDMSAAYSRVFVQRVVFGRINNIKMDRRNNIMDRLLFFSPSEMVQAITMTKRLSHNVRKSVSFNYKAAVKTYHNLLGFSNSIYQIFLFFSCPPLVNLDFFRYPL